MREARFWGVLICVAAMAALHLWVDTSRALQSSPFPEGSPVALLLLPILYSALRYGLAGSIATAALAMLLWLPDLILPDAMGHPGSDVVNLAITDAVAVFVGFHLDRERAVREHAEALERAHTEASRSYASALLTAQESERGRIARDLHDDPLQRLINVSRKVMSSEPAEAEALRAELLDVIARLRDITRGLRPPGLDQFGLTPAVRGMLADVEDAGATALELTVTGTPDRLRPELELGAYRIIQEAVRNALHHGRPRHIQVGLAYQDGELQIRVSDDGRGFAVPPDGEPPGTHVGLVGMRERASLLGGDCAIASVPGSGTTVCASLPVRPPLSVPAVAG